MKKKSFLSQFVMENMGKICLLIDYQSAYVDAVEDMINLHYISLTKVTKKDYDHKKDKIEPAFDLFVILMETHTDYELLKSVTSQHEPDNKAIILIFADIHLVNKSKIFTRENIDYIIPPFLRSEFENKLNLILQNKQIKQQSLKKKPSEAATIIHEYEELSKEFHLIEDKYDKLSQISFEGILIHKKGIVLEVNDSLVDFTGYTREELTGKNIIQMLIPIEYHEVVKQNITKNITGPYEIVARKKDGTLISVEIAAKNITYKGEQARMTVIRNISEIKSVQKKLIESNEKLQAILDNTSNFLGLLTREGTIIEVNQTALDFARVDKSEVIHSPFHKTAWWREDIDVQNRLSQSIARASKGEHVRYETTHKNYKGETRIIDFSLKPVYNRNNEIVYIVAEGRDITEHKKIEQEIRESEEKFRLLIENTPAVVWSTSEKGETNYISPNIKQLYGFSAKEIYNDGKKLWLDRVHPDDKKNIQQAFNALFSKNVKYNVTYRIQRMDREWIWLHDQANIIREINGIQYAIGVLQDITKSKETEQTLEKLNKELFASNEKLRKTLDNLKEQETKYFSLFEYANDSIFLMDKDVFLDCNIKTLEIFQCDRHDIIGNKPYFFSPEYQPNGRPSKESAREKISSALAGQPQSFEWQHKKSDGTLFDAEVSLNSIIIKDKKLILAIVRDVTERKKAKAELERLQNLLMIAIEQSPSGILVAEAPEVRVQIANSAALEIMGKSENAIHDVPVHEHATNWNAYTPDMELYGPEELPLSQAIIEGVTTKNKEVIILNEKGEYRWLSANAAPVTDSHNKIIAGIVVFQDITEQKKNVQKLVESRERFALAMEATNEGLWDYDFNKKDFEYLSPRCYTMLGYEPQEFPPTLQAWSMIEHPENNTKVKWEAFINVKTKRYENEMRLKNRQGQYIWISARGSVVKYNKTGKPVRALGTFMNIHEKKVAEIEIKMYKENLELLVKERTEEIEQLNRELLASNEELQQTNSMLALQKEKLIQTIKQLQNAQEQLIQSEKMASLGVLTAGIAHEINNPINFINSGNTGLKIHIERLIKTLQQYREHVTKKSMTIDTTETDEAIEATQKMQHIIQVGIERTVEIIKSLKSFSRMDDERLGHVNVNELFENTLTILYHQYKNRIAILKEYDKNIPPVYCSRGKINQVIMNLLLNAVQAIEKKGAIKISTSYQKDKKNVVIKIRDSGKGIPDEIKDKIFDPFFTTKKVGEGTGLGLSIVFGIISKHQGDIRLNNRVKNGAEFIVTLPAG